MQPKKAFYNDPTQEAPLQIKESADKDGLTVLFTLDSERYPSCSSEPLSIAIDKENNLVSKRGSQSASVPAKLAPKAFFSFVSDAYKSGVIDEEQYLAATLYDSIMRGLGKNQQWRTPDMHARVLKDIFIHHKLDGVPDIDKHLKKLKKKQPPPSADGPQIIEPTAPEIDTHPQTEPISMDSEPSKDTTENDQEESVIVYQNKRCTLGFSTNKCYITLADGETYYLSYHPYEPCTYVYKADCHDDSKIICIHNAFAVTDTVRRFARGETETAITGVRYDAPRFCKLILYVIAHPGNWDIDVAEIRAGIR